MPRSERYKLAAETALGRGSKWETQYRKDPLKRQLLAVLIAIESMADNRDHRPLRQPISAPLGYELVSYRSVYDLTTHEIVQHRVIRAVTEGVKFWEQSTHTFGGSDQEEITLIGSGQLTLHSKGPYPATNPGKAFMMRVDLPGVLKNGEEFEFTLLHRKAGPLDLHPAGWLEERHFVPSLTTGSATIEIRFSPQRRPSNIWAFSGCAPWLAPGLPTAGNLISLAQSNVARWSWQSPRVGRAYGLGWEW